MFTHSKPTPLPTVPENLRVLGFGNDLKPKPAWGWYTTAKPSDMRRIPSFRAIEVTKQIQAAETLVKLKHDKDS